MAVIYFAFAGLGTLLKERVDILKSVVALFGNIPAYIIGIALTVFCLILVFILLKISIAMINKKEYWCRIYTIIYYNCVCSYCLKIHFKVKITVTITNHCLKSYIFRFIEILFFSFQQTCLIDFYDYSIAF